MKRVRIPNTDLGVSGLCLGAAEFGARIDRAAAFRLLDAYAEAGGNFIDTASVYADWAAPAKSSSEKIIGAWLAERRSRSRIVLATKGAHPPLENMQQSRLAPADIVHDLEQSLRNLRTDVIDLYYLHRDDTARPVGEIVETLAAQQRAGKLRAFGCSNWRAARLRAAQQYAVTHGLPGFAANQMFWSLAVHGPLPDPTTAAMDGEMYALHRDSGLAAIPYSSQARGVFYKLAQGGEARLSAGERSLYPPAPNLKRLRCAQKLAAELGVGLTAIVLGYLQSQPFVTVPILGSRTVEQLADSLAAGSTRLSPAQLAYLEQGAE